MIDEYLIELVQKGLWITVSVSAVSWLVAAAFGVFLGVVGDSRSRTLREVQFFISTIFRSFPELLAIYLIYFGLSRYLSLSAFSATVIALGISQTGFFSEGARAALQLVPEGQRNASRAFGLNQFQMYRLVLLPQMARALVPPALNMFLGLMKLSTYAAAVGLPELLYTGRTIMNRDYQVVSVSISVALIFIAISVPLSRLVAVLEGRRSRLHSSAELPVLP